MPFRACKVSFSERGQRHEAEVDAETAFEAAALALKFWDTRHYVVGPSRHTTLEVEINTPARMLIEVKVATLLDWLYVKTPKTPAEAARVHRLRDLLADDRH